MSPRGPIRYDTAPALRYGHEPMLTLTETSREAELFDAVGIAAELERLAEVHSGNARELRLAVSRHLRGALARGRASIEGLLLADRHGRRCDGRLSHMQAQSACFLFAFWIKPRYP